MVWITVISLVIAAISAMAAWFAAFQTKKAAEANLLFDFLSKLENRDMVVTRRAMEDWLDEGVKGWVHSHMRNQGREAEASMAPLAIARSLKTNRIGLFEIPITLEEWYEEMFTILSSLILMRKKGLISEKVFSAMISNESVPVLLQALPLVGSLYDSSLRREKELYKALCNSITLPPVDWGNNWEKIGKEAVLRLEEEAQWR